MFERWICRLVAAGLHRHLNILQENIVSQVSDVVNAAVADLKADLFAKLTVIEDALTAALANASNPDDFAPALQGIADMKAAVDAAAPVPATPPVDTPAP